MTKQRILFITTGGTIASVRTQQGLKPVLTSEELLAHLPELKDLCMPGNAGAVQHRQHRPRAGALAHDGHAPCRRTTLCTMASSSATAPIRWPTRPQRSPT